MSGDRVDRRWQQLANDLEFTRLPELRRQAEGWRTGLTGLTTLVALLVLLKGRDGLADLPGWAQWTAGALLVVAFLLLLVGSLFAVRAAHGSPGAQLVLGGQALRRWTEQEADRVAGFLARATWCCLLGVLSVVVAVGVAWVTTEEPKPHLVRVRTTTGGVCGSLVSVDGQRVVVRTDEKGTETAVPVADLVSVTPVTTCGAARRP